MIVNQLNLLSRTNFGMVTHSVCRKLSSQIKNADNYGYKLKQLSDDIIYTGETKVVDTLEGCMA